MYRSIQCFWICILSVFAGNNSIAQQQPVLFKNALLIDGKGGKPVVTNMLIHNGSITAIGNHIKTADATVIDASGKTIMPALISAHVHIGVLKGTRASSYNYTRENVLRQLEKYGRYGVENIMVLGTDVPLLFNSGIRDSSVNGLLAGARIHTAGYGFNVPSNAPKGGMMDYVFRPSAAAQVPAEMDSLAALKVDAVKMWVDDFGGTTPKMKPEVYTAIINEAHKHNIRVASHLYYLADARKLVAAGVDIIAHSIRDSVIDDALLQQMKAKHVAYIPTLSLDEFAFIYASRPEWIEDEFFKASLEPGVYEMITSTRYQDSLKNSPSYQKNIKGFEIALINLKKIYDAGILVALGTDSGATPLRAQGFSEHHELQLLVLAGLTPLQAIKVATKNAAETLQISDHYGTLEQGKVADFIILDADPSQNIKNTMQINAVYKAGMQVK